MMNFFLYISNYMFNLNPTDIKTSSLHLTCCQMRVFASLILNPFNRYTLYRHVVDQVLCVFWKPFPYKIRDYCSLVCVPKGHRESKVQAGKRTHTEQPLLSYLCLRLLFPLVYIIKTQEQHNEIQIDRTQQVVHSRVNSFLTQQEYYIDQKKLGRKGFSIPKI